jgi:hypothetical protein
MSEKKDETKIIELMKPSSKVESLKKSFSNLRKFNAKSSVKKVGRSRNQKGHKNY